MTYLRIVMTQEMTKLKEAADSLDDKTVAELRNKLENLEIGEGGEIWNNEAFPREPDAEEAGSDDDSE